MSATAFDVTSTRSNERRWLQSRFWENNPRVTSDLKPKICRKCTKEWAGLACRWGLTGRSEEWIVLYTLGTPESLTINSRRIFWEFTLLRLLNVKFERQQDLFSPNPTEIRLIPLPRCSSSIPAIFVELRRCYADQRRLLRELMVLEESSPFISKTTDFLLHSR